MTQVAKVKISKDSAGDWRWSGYAANGEQLTKSSEGYEHKRWAEDVSKALFPDAVQEVQE